MDGDISVATWTGIASCAVACGCWFASTLQYTQARQLHSARPIDRLSDLKELLQVLPLFVSVTGKAWASKPLECDLADQQAVLVEYKELKHSKARNDQGTWHPQLEQVRHSFRSTAWSLKDGSSQELPVIDAHSADYLYMPLAGEVYIDADAAEASNTTASRIAMRTMDALQGFKVLGTQKQEKALPIGTDLTVVGEVVSTQPGSRRGILHLQRPHNGKPFVISNKSLDSVIKSYEQKADGFKLAAGVFGTIGLVIFGAKLIQYGVFKWRQRGIRQRREEADLRRAALRQTQAAAAIAAGNGDALPEADAEEGAGTCVICLERDSDSVFQACGHLCTCSDCSRNLNRCPICRTRTRAIRVYRT